MNDSSATQLGVFGRRGGALEPGSSHILIPEWTGLNGSHLVVLIGRWNDETIDDRLNLANESTGLQEQGSLVPSDYLLCQNYLNPFNPLTTIRYGLPQKSVVRLAVYSFLGQEVAVLVQGEQAAGSLLAPERVVAKTYVSSGSAHDRAFQRPLPVAIWNMVEISQSFSAVSRPIPESRVKTNVSFHPGISYSFVLSADSF